MNVSSTRFPRRTFLPVRVCGAGLAKPDSSDRNRTRFDGDGLTGSAIFHALICLVPTVISVLPYQTISDMLVVHRFAECNFTLPDFVLTDHINRNPSLGSPSVARYLPSGLKATALTPKVCSDMIDSGTLALASSAVEKTRTLGLYPVSPMASSRPSGLIETLFAAFIRSLAVHV